jgi:hypothetical protein
MTQEHPITPPPELFAEWFANSLKKLDRTVSRDGRGTAGLVSGEVATQAARWGADQELMACINWLYENDWKAVHKHLRDARRPKPPSLKEEALKMLDNLERCTDGDYYTIRFALEQLDD